MKRVLLLVPGPARDVDLRVGFRYESSSPENRAVLFDFRRTGL